MRPDLFTTEEAAAGAAARAWTLVEAMYPLCRSLTGDGVR
ncbi:MAG: hypothetical protein RL456_1236, partial [Pseudomonadota bacterium]